MRLRLYQREAVDRVFEVFDRGVKNALVVLPTGAGKTVLFSAVIRETLAEYDSSAGAVALVIAHRRELLIQAQDKYLAADPNESVGIYQADRREAWARVICASRASLYGDTYHDDGTLKKRGRINDLPLARIKLIVIDEAHHAPARTYIELLEAVRKESPDCLLLGVTATPYRADGGLGTLWSHYLDHPRERSLVRHTGPPEDVTGAVAMTLGIRDGWDMGFLVPLSPRSSKIVMDIDLGKVKTSKQAKGGGEEGDFLEADLARVMDTVDVRQLVVDKWFQHAGPGTLDAGPEGRPTIIFTAGVTAASRMAEAFKERGVRCASIDGKMKANDRVALLAAFEAGRFLVLINCQVLTEGYDNPSVACICVCRPTKSKSMFVQMVGRGLRMVGQTIEESITNGKPDCLLLNFGSATLDTMGEADLDGPVEIDGVDRTDAEKAEEEIAKSTPEEMEQTVADCMMGDAARRVTIRGVSEYPIDLFGDGKVAWTVINGTRICVIRPGVAVLVYADRGGEGCTAIALAGMLFRELATKAPEHEAIARAQAYAILHGSKSFLKPGIWFTGRVSTDAQVAELRRSIDANMAMDRRLRRADLDISGLPSDLALTSIAQSSAWIAYLHARAAFGTRVAAQVEALPSAVSLPEQLARMRAATAPTAGRARA